MKAMSRRRFLRASAGGAACVGAAAVGGGLARALADVPAPGGRAAGARPNIVFLFADDLAYADLSCFDELDGQADTRIQTPHLDSLAADGSQFTSFYAGNSVCSPSRAGLLTGRYARRSGANTIYFPHDTSGMALSEVTIAEKLKEAGYRTACVGKWHLGIGTGGLSGLPDKAEYMPTRRGFDEYFGIPYSNDMNKENRGHPPIPLVRGERIVEGGPGTAYGTVDQRFLTKRYTIEGIKFIRRAHAAKQPFFLYLAHSMPHVPLYRTRHFAGKSAFNGPFGDVVEEIDHNVGLLLRELKRLGIEQDTLVVFTSDNGPWLSKPDTDHGRALPFAGGKGTPYEGGYRVPMVARWPGTVPAGREVADPMHIHDVFPTFCTLAGVDPPTDRPFDGADCTALLTGTGTRLGGEADFRFFYYRNSGHSRHILAYRKGHWKLHVDDGNNATELYDFTTAAGLYETAAGNQVNSADPAVQAIRDTMRAELVAFEQDIG